MTEAETSSNGGPDAGLSELQVTVTSDMTALLDFSAPQERFLSLIDAGGFLEPIEGTAMHFDRETIEYVLHNPALFSSEVEMNLGNVRPLIPLNVDPPRHSKYRRLLDPLFSPKRMDAHEADIAERANALIDTFIDDGGCNFTDDFADVLPTSVFLGLTGLPVDRVGEFMRLRDGILHAEKHDPGALFDPEIRQQVLNRTGAEIYALFEDLIDARAKHPQDDVISQFLAADVEGERLTREDILDILFLFLIAGLDTVSDTLTCFFAFLAQHPEHRRQIADDPSCIDGAVEELLRWEAPVPFSSPRTATEDVTLPNGCKMPAGSMVLLAYGSANVDPSEYPDGTEVRFDRTRNRHITFGLGPHRCLGSHLARRELRITLREWHRRIPDYWLTPGHEELHYPPGLRHVRDLMLSWS
jgi:cytochrome P450